MCPPGVDACALCARAEEAARLQAQLRDLHFVEAGMLDNRKKIDVAGEALAAAERKTADATHRCAARTSSKDLPFKNAGRPSCARAAVAV